MPSRDVVLSEAENEAVKALLRAHKAMMDAKPDGPLYIIALPEVCRPVVFAATGRELTVAVGRGILVEEGALTNTMLERLEKL